MRVRLKVDISGTRDGHDWPPRGAVVDLPADEAMGLIGSNMAEATGDHTADIERAVLPEAETRRGPKVRAGLTKASMEGDGP